MEPVTTFSGDTNWSSINTGLLAVLVGMMLVSNRSNRRERLLHLARVSARDCHFPARWFAQILAGCTNIFLRGSDELFELPPALRRIEPRGRHFETL
jgi:hypothetical protein